VHVRAAQANGAAAPAAPEEGKEIVGLLGRNPLGRMGLVALARRALGEPPIARIGVLWPLGPAGVDLAAIEALALLFVRQEIVGAGDLLEAGFRRLVAGVEIGMVLFGELAVSGAEFVLARFLLDAQNFVGITRGHGPAI
jgi:hypothetical protein